MHATTVHDDAHAQKQRHEPRHDQANVRAVLAVPAQVRAQRLGVAVLALTTHEACPAHARECCGAAATHAATTQPRTRPCSCTDFLARPTNGAQPLLLAVGKRWAADTVRAAVHADQFSLYNAVEACQHKVARLSCNMRTPGTNPTVGRTVSDVDLVATETHRALSRAEMTTAVVGDLV